MDALPPAWHAPPAIIRPAGAGGFLPAPPPGLPAGRYRAVIGEVRAGLGRGLRTLPGYRVAILDVTASDFDAEVRRIEPGLRARAGELRELGAGMGAYSVAYPVGAGLACLAAGHPPGTDIGRLLEAVAGGTVVRNGLDDEAFARIALWHEAAHCLLGRSEAEADAFAFLAVLRDASVPDGALATWAAWREVAEISNPDDADDHVSASVLWAVLARADALRADPAFRDLDAEGLARLARAYAARHGLDGAGRAHLVRMRRAVAAGAVLVASAYPERGPASLASLSAWLDGVGDAPGFARLRDLRRALAEGAYPMRPARPDPGGFETFLRGRAAAGDPVAEAMLASRPPSAARTGARAPTFGERMAARIPYRIVPGAAAARLAALPATWPSAETARAGTADAHAAAVPARP